MGMVTVRVVPRSGRSTLEIRGPEVVLRVRAAAEAGRATEEARRLLAETLGVAPSRVRLYRGTRSRTKTFAVDGLGSEELQMRLRAT